MLRRKTFLNVKELKLKLKKCVKQSGKEIAKCLDIGSNAIVPNGFVVSGKLPGES
jgi:hypothetical protein